MANFPKRISDTLQGQHHKWWALGTVGTGVLMATLDSGIVSVSLPTIMHDFRVDVATIQWVVLAYLLMITITLLAFGRLADMFGRKHVYTLGFIIFTLGSALCGAAATAPQLVAFRAIQALGASMLMANGLAITSSVFPPSERGKALGIQSTVVATGVTIGPTIGGLITEWFGWRYIFYVNLPIGVIGIIMATAILRESVITPTLAGPRPKFDFPGAMLAGAGLLALLFAMSGVGALGMSGTVVGSLYMVAAVLLLAFVLVEIHTAEPMIDLGLFRERLFALGSSASLLSFLAASANVFILPFYLQLILGYPPGQAGMLMVPTSLVTAVVAPASGWLSDRIGARLLSSAGLALVCLALLSLGALSASSGYGDVLTRLALLGLGQGLFMSPNTSSVIGSVPRHRYGVVGGFLSTMRNLGLVMGTAVATTLLISGLVSAAGDVSLDSLSVLGTTRDPVLLGGFMLGMRRAYWTAAGLAAIGMLASLSRGGSFGRKAPMLPTDRDPTAATISLGPGSPRR